MFTNYVPAGEQRHGIQSDASNKPWRTLAAFDELAEAERFARQNEGARIIDTVASFRSKQRPPWP